MAQDFLGKTLNVGDKVAFIQIGYRTLRKGTIKSISEKTVVISHEQFNTGGKETKQYHGQVIKYEDAPKTEFSREYADAYDGFYGEGLDESDNPHESGSKEAQEWYNGWRAAYDEYQNKLGN